MHGLPDAAPLRSVRRQIELCCFLRWFCVVVDFLVCAASCTPRLKIPIPTHGGDRSTTHRRGGGRSANVHEQLVHLKIPCMPGGKHLTDPTENWVSNLQWVHGFQKDACTPGKGTDTRKPSLVAELHPQVILQTLN